MIWFCACPEFVTDDYGKRGVCKAMARITRTDDMWSTSGWVISARIRCDAGHVCTQLFEDVLLLG